MRIVYLNFTLLMYTGALPYIDVHPEIPGTVEPGDFLQLKCTATGKGSLHYVWQHENQTLVNETRPELIIKHVKESEQGEYKCCVTNAFGCVFSNPAVLKLCEYVIPYFVLSVKLTVLHTYSASYLQSASECAIYTLPAS